MILADHTIRRAIENDGDDPFGHNITIEPEPEPEQFQPASFDVRLGDEIYDPRADTIRDDLETVTIIPGEPVLGTTLDHIELPNDVAAQLTGRSSLGRQFVTVHQTAGWLDPGFRGTITLEIINVGHDVVELDVGERVAQLVFFPTDVPTSGYSGQYQDQRHPEL